MNKHIIGKFRIDSQVPAREYRWSITDTTHGSNNELHISRMRIYSGLNDPYTNPLHSPESNYINSTNGSFIVPDLIPHRHVLSSIIHSWINNKYKSIFYYSNFSRTRQQDQARIVVLYDPTYATNASYTAFSISIRI